MAKADVILQIRADGSEQAIGELRRVQRTMLKIDEETQKKLDKSKTRTLTIQDSSGEYRRLFQVLNTETKKYQTVSEHAISSANDKWRDHIRQLQEVARWRKMVATAERDNLRYDQQRDAAVQRMGRTQSAAAAADLRMSTAQRVASSNASYAQGLMRQPGSIVSNVTAFNPATGQSERVVTLMDRATNAMYRYNTATQQLTRVQGDLAKANMATGESFGHIVYKMATWAAAGTLIFGTVRGLKGMITAFGDIEKQQIELTRVADNFGEGQRGLGNTSRSVTRDVLDQSIAFGTNSTEAMKAATIWARLGQSQGQIKESMKATLALSNLSGVGPEEAAVGLESMMQQFQLSADELPKLVDKMTYIDQISRVTMKDLMDAGSRTASAWKEAGGGVEDFLAVVSVVAQRTGRPGAEIANAMKTIVTRTGQPEIQKKLFDLAGISAIDMEGNLKAPLKILDELAAKKKELTSGEWFELLGAEAGARQVNVLSAMLAGMPEIHRQIAAQVNATGAALRSNENVMDGLNKKTEQLGASWDAFSHSVASGLVGEKLKDILDLTRKIISTTAEKGGSKADETSWFSFEPLSNRFLDEGFAEQEAMRNAQRLQEITDIRLRRSRLRKEMERGLGGPLSTPDFQDAQEAARAKELAARAARKPIPSVFGNISRMERDTLFDVLPKANLMDIINDESGWQKRIAEASKEIKDIQATLSEDMKWAEFYGIDEADAAQQKVALVAEAMKKIKAIETGMRDSQWRGVLGALGGQDPMARITGLNVEAEAAIAAKRVQAQTRRDRQKLVDELMHETFMTQAMKSDVGKADRFDNRVIAAQREQEFHKQQMGLAAGQMMGLAAAGNQMGAADARLRMFEMSKQLALDELRINIEKQRAEQDITKEKQRQIEATRKQLGLLSDEDLLKARILAAEVRSGKIGPLSQGQYLSTPEKQRAFLNNVAPGLVPELTFMPDAAAARAARTANAEPTSVADVGVNPGEGARSAFERTHGYKPTAGYGAGVDWSQGAVAPPMAPPEAMMVGAPQVNVTIGGEDILPLVTMTVQNAMAEFVERSKPVGQPAPVKVGARSR